MKLHIAKNALEHDWEEIETDDAVRSIYDYFEGKWPVTARIYQGTVSQQTEVTPRNESLEVDVVQLRSIQDDLFVIVYPAGPQAFVAIMVFQIALSIGHQLFDNKPKVKPLRHDPGGSSNNLLADRQNTARLNARIPAIYGQQLSYPDLIQTPYRIFVDQQEVEICYMCIGEGSYDINVNTFVRDGDTAIQDIRGASALVYGPGTSPNFGSPFVTFGEAFTEPLVDIVRVNEVNGQDLLSVSESSIPTPEDANLFDPTSTWRFVQPNILKLQSGAAAPNGPTGPWNFSVTDYVHVGQRIQITTNPAAWSTGSLNFSGFYIVDDIPDENTIVLADAATVAPDWDLIDDVYGVGYTEAISNSIRDIPLLGVNGQRLRIFPDVWEGPFLVRQECQEVWCNFFAPRGLWANDGVNLWRQVALMQVELTPCDIDGTPTGSPQVFTDYLIGSSASSSYRGLTMKCVPTVGGFQLVRARKFNVYVPTPGDVTTAASFGNLPNIRNSQVQVQWVDCYGVVYVNKLSFGNITTVHTRIPNNRDSLSVKNRKFNVLVIREVPRWNGSGFNPASGARNASDIFFAVAMDPNIGNTNDVDFAGVAAAFTGLINTVNVFAQIFDHTFDDTNDSTEDMLQAIASACHCIAYREGGIIKVRPDVRTFNGTMIFNHRNKFPGSETRGVRFAPQDDNDGVEVDYVDDLDYSIQTFRYPPRGTARNPKFVDVVGLHSYVKAFLHGMRAYAKLKFANTTTEFEATREAAATYINDLILVADNTKPVDGSTEKDGDVLAIDGLEITCSQDATVIGVASVFLQHTDGTTESIPCSTGSAPNKLLLSFPPSLPLVTDINEGVRTRYIVAVDSDLRTRKFLLTSKTPNSTHLYKMSAINYSDLYYINDNIVLWQKAFELDLPFFHDIGPARRAVTVFGGTPTFDGDRLDMVWRGTTDGDGVQYGASLVLTAGIPTTYSIGFWFKINLADATGANDVISTIHQAIFVDQATNELKVMHGGVTYASTVLASSDWQFCVVSYSSVSGGMFLFLDGNVVDFASSVPAATFTTNVVVGGGVLPADTFIGYIHDLRVWTRTMSTDEVVAIYNSEKEPL